MIPFLASIPSPSRNVIEVGPLTIHFYGIMIAIGVIVAVIVTKRRYERFGGSGEMVERASIWAVVVGFLGARLAYVSTHTGDFLDRPWAMLYIWEGGLALYGGLVAGTIAAVVVLRRSRGDVFAFGDAVAVGLPLAQVIGRLGNYFNQELFGTPSTLPWAVEIDANIAAAAGYPGYRNVPSDVPLRGFVERVRHGRCHPAAGAARQAVQGFFDRGVHDPVRHRPVPDGADADRHHIPFPRFESQRMGVDRSGTDRSRPVLVDAAAP